MDKIVIVIDSGVAVKWFVHESYSAEALRILNEYQAGRLDLLAPGLIYAEIGNVAWKSIPASPQRQARARNRCPLALAWRCGLARMPPPFGTDS